MIYIRRITKPERIFDDIRVHRGLGECNCTASGLEPDGVKVGIHQSNTEGTRLI
jgi:hypothetical protein